MPQFSLIHCMPSGADTTVPLHLQTNSGIFLKTQWRLRSILTFFLESVEFLDDLDSSCTKLEVDLVFDYCTA